MVAPGIPTLQLEFECTTTKVDVDEVTGGQRLGQISTSPNSCDSSCPFYVFPENGYGYMLDKM